MCFKMYLKEKVTLSSCIQIESFLSLFAHIRMIVVKNGYIYKNNYTKIYNNIQKYKQFFL